MSCPTISISLISNWAKFRLCMMNALQIVYARLICIVFFISAHKIKLPYWQSWVFLKSELNSLIALTVLNIPRQNWKSFLNIIRQDRTPFFIIFWLSSLRMMQYVWFKNYHPLLFSLTLEILLLLDLITHATH